MRGPVEEVGVSLSPFSRRQVLCGEGCTTYARERVEIVSETHIYA